MCTLIVLHRCVPGRPLIVAANRDEFHARPAEGPGIRELRAGRILAPLDLEAGGTWLGLNDRGVFAALTNLRSWTPGPGVAVADGDGAEEADEGVASISMGAHGVVDGLVVGPAGAKARRSRGEIVMHALETGSAAEAARWLGRLELESERERSAGADRSERAYEPFQLVVADEHEAWQLVYGDRFRLTSLEPGVHVVGNVEDEWVEARPEEPRARKLGRVRTRVEKLLTESGEGLLEELAAICREHVEPTGHERVRSTDPTRRRSEQDPEDALAATCVHVGNVYGTRSSILLELATEREKSRLWASAGPPCETPYEDLSPLLRRLDVRSIPWSAAEPQARTNG